MDIQKMNRLTFWCQKVLPLVYDDSLSYYELLCKVVDYINNLIKNQNDIINVLEIQGSDIAVLKNDVKFLMEELDKIKNGEYMGVYLQAIEKWIDKNLPTIIQNSVKYIFFGLTDDGYFCAYVPEKWQFINFDTIMNYDDDLYGHLIMEW